MANEFGQIESKIVMPESYDPISGALSGSLSYRVANRDHDAKLVQEDTYVQLDAATLSPVTTEYTYNGPYLSRVTFEDETYMEFLNHNDVGQPRTVKDQLSRTTQLSYDQYNEGPNVLERRIVMEDDGEDLVTGYTYTNGNLGVPAGLLETHTDPLERITTYEYYDSADVPSVDPKIYGQLKRITYHDSTFESFAYAISASGMEVEHTDELGRKRTEYYDSLNRLVKVEEPDPDGQLPFVMPTTHYRYDTAGNLREVIDAEMNSTTFEYDARNRLIKLTRQAGDPAPSTEYRYDGAGNLIAEIDPLGRMSVWQYDAADRMIAEIGPDVDEIITATWQNPVNRYDVNADGAVDTLDQESFALAGLSGALTPLALDELPLVSGEAGILFYVDVDGDNDVDQFDEDAVAAYLANPANPSLDPDGPNYGDPLGRPITRYGYDPAGNVRFMIDAKGEETAYEYDVRSLRTKVLAPAVPDPAQSGTLIRPTTVFAFDDARQLEDVIDALGRTTSYVFDNASRLVAVSGPDPDGSTPIWRNETSPFDVDHNGVVDANDKQLVIDVYDAGAQGGTNHSLMSYFQGHATTWPPYNAQGVGMELQLSGPTPEQGFVDLNGDGFIGLADIDLISDFVDQGIVGTAIATAPNIAVLL